MKVNPGDIMAFIYWGRVERVNYDSLDVVDLDNHNRFGVNGRALIDQSLSADFFDKEEKVTQTKAAEILITAINQPFTVRFTKQNNDERTLRGRLVKPEPLLGRSHVYDLEVAKGSPLRLVDHRTIQWIIVGGVKYVVK